MAKENIDDLDFSRVKLNRIREYMRELGWFITYIVRKKFPQEKIDYSLAYYKGLKYQIPKDEKHPKYLKKVKEIMHTIHRINKEPYEYIWKNLRNPKPYSQLSYIRANLNNAKVVFCICGAVIDKWHDIDNKKWSKLIETRNGVVCSKKCRKKIHKYFRRRSFANLVVAIIEKKWLCPDCYSKSVVIMNEYYVEKNIDGITISEKLKKVGKFRCRDCHNEWKFFIAKNWKVYGGWYFHGKWQGIGNKPDKICPCPKCTEKKRKIKTLGVPYHGGEPRF
jgi:Zn finger protein HypA/HybF involved in hydrogenase expression